MYIPKHFQLKEHSRIVDFLKENNFGILLSSTERAPVGTHLPFIIKEEEENITLLTHLAMANPQRELLANDNEVLVVFHGPHAYITPDFYDHKINVPTWNYTAVHLYGIPHLITDENEMIEVLLESFRSFEPKFERQWTTLPEDYKSGLLKGIVAAGIRVTKIQAKFKLSQNKTLNEQKTIIDSFEKSEDYMLTGIAKLMKENIGTQ